MSKMVDAGDIQKLKSFVAEITQKDPPSCYSMQYALERLKITDVTVHIVPIKGRDETDTKNITIRNFTAAFTFRGRVETGIIARTSKNRFYFTFLDQHEKTSVNVYLS